MRSSWKLYGTNIFREIVENYVHDQKQSYSWQAVINLQVRSVLPVAVDSEKSTESILLSMLC